MEDVTVDIGRPLNARNLKSMGVIEQVRIKPTQDTSWEALKDQRKNPNGLYLFSKIDPPEVVAHYLQDLANQGVDISEFSVDWLPEHPPNLMKRQREPSGKSKKAKKAKLRETSGSRALVPLADSPITSPPPEQQNPPPSDQPQTPPPARQSNPPPEQPIPSPSEPQPNPPPQQPIPSSSEPQPNPQPEQTTSSPSVIPSPPTSVATIIPIQNPDDTNQTPPSSPAFDSEPETAFPILEEAIIVFAESSVEKIKCLSINSGINDDPFTVRIHWNRVIRWITSESFKLKGLFEQVHNDFIRDADIRLQARLAREDEEKVRKEAEEKARLEEEQRTREDEEKVVGEVVAVAAAAEAEAQAKAEAEEVARVVVEEAAKASADALTQGEKSNSERHDSRSERDRLENTSSISESDSDSDNTLSSSLSEPYGLSIVVINATLGFSSSESSSSDSESSGVAISPFSPLEKFFLGLLSFFNLGQSFL
ncbi:eukaryotic translation initiation factor 4 gamma-like [Lathyrus oleraceus]|uniref:eukaryotic translation initiation factor 4 gamma-like n=1 Tax=Pisum sativum TaxID=3888 RepID=UPI0021D3AEE5|nr:eukaryotic translation initiation factor 4 gamma-like [Pisum sativum]